MNLVTDRTQADVQERNAKGTYNASDINRVNEAAVYLADEARDILETLEAYRESMGVANAPIFQPYIAEDVDVELPVIEGAASRLPDGYTELEYIESSGTQYINTAFKPNQDTRVVMDIHATGQSKTSACIFGERNANSPAASQAYIAWSMKSGTTVRSDYFGNSVTGSFSILNSRLTIDKNKNVCDFGGTAVTNTEATGQSDLNMYLLACNNLGTPNYYLNAKLYSCQIYDNGNLVRDYVPVKNLSGEIGLYDLAGKQFYGNAGTGTFSHGPVVITTPPAPQNLRQTGKTLESISLAWDVVDASNGYKLYRDGTLIATQTATSYTDTGLLPSESHSYQVLAYNDQGDGTLSESVSMSTEQAYYVVTPVFTSAVFSPNPTTINTPVILSVAVEDQMIILQPEVFQSNEIYSGEAS